MTSEEKYHAVMDLLAKKQEYTIREMKNAAVDGKPVAHLASRLAAYVSLEEEIERLDAPTHRQSLPKHESY